jgi:hypothetical protein
VVPCYLGACCAPAVAAPLLQLELRPLFQQLQSITAGGPRAGSGALLAPTHCASHNPGRPPPVDVQPQHLVQQRLPVRQQGQLLPRAGGALLQAGGGLLEALLRGGAWTARGAERASLPQAWPKPPCHTGRCETGPRSPRQARTRSRRFHHGAGRLSAGPHARPPSRTRSRRETQGLDRAMYWGKMAARLCGLGRQAQHAPCVLHRCQWRPQLDRGIEPLQLPWA